MNEPKTITIQALKDFIQQAKQASGPLPNDAFIVHQIELFVDGEHGKLHDLAMTLIDGTN